MSTVAQVIGVTVCAVSIMSVVGGLVAGWRMETTSSERGEVKNR